MRTSKINIRKLASSTYKS